MTNEEIILNAADKMAEAVTSEHFHNIGLMDDQVNPIEWNNYFDNARNAILDAACKYEN